jgi:shikimate kinase
LRFVDVDRLIEERDRRTIQQIFEQVGEGAFRQLEYTLLKELLSIRDAGCYVLALGGGAFAQPGVRNLLSHAQVPAVFLDARPEELFRRCEQPGVVRPLRQDLQQFSNLYERRRDSYGQAEVRVDTTNRDISSIVEEIVSELALVPNSGVDQ